MIPDGKRTKREGKENLDGYMSGLTLEMFAVGSRLA